VSQNGLLTTIGWKLGGEVTYCLEGSVFIAGAVVQWLRDGLKAIKSSAEVQPLAATVPDSDGVYVVPAFVGLGAPYWDPYARGTIIGLTRNSSIAHIARASVESMAYQSRDLLDALLADGLAALGVTRDADLAETVLREQARLQNLEAAVERGLLGRDVARDTERVADAELLAAREGFVELLAALELARDDVRRRREAELLDATRERDDVVDRRAGRVRHVHTRPRLQLGTDRIELLRVVRRDLDRVVAQER
jgi:hypothetical protein